MRALLLGVVLCVLAVSACRAADGGKGAKAAGNWRLVELDGAAPALARAPELQIEVDGTLRGFAGVNRFSGQAELEAFGQGEIRSGPMIATRMAGSPEAMELEARFLALLAAPLEWRRRGGELQLLQDGSVKARFVAAE